MGKILEDIDESAHWIRNAFSSLGVNLDFSLASLKEVNKFIESEFKEGKPREGSIVKPDPGAIIFALGSYLGEVILTEAGKGRWLPNSDNEEDEINIRIEIDERYVAWPMIKMMEKVKDPKVDLYIYASEFLKFTAEKS